MVRSKVQDIKKRQKESLFLREISNLFLKATYDDARLQDLIVNRVKFSEDKGTCFVYFYSTKGEEKFEELLDVLRLYKPSLRKALADAIKGRYVPDLIFQYDKEFEKQQAVEDLMDKLKKEGKL